MINTKGYLALSAALSILAAACQPHARQDTPVRVASDGRESREQRFYRFVHGLLPPVPPGTRRAIRLETPFDSSNGSVNEYTWSVASGRDETKAPSAEELRGYVRFRKSGDVDIFTITNGSAFPTAELDAARNDIARTGKADFVRLSAAYPPESEKKIALRLQQIAPSIEAIIGYPLNNPLLEFRLCSRISSPNACQPQGTWEADYDTKSGGRRSLHVLLELEPIHGQLILISVQ